MSGFSRETLFSSALEIGHGAFTHSQVKAHPTAGNTSFLAKFGNATVQSTHLRSLLFVHDDKSTKVRTNALDKNASAYYNKRRWNADAY